MILALTVSGLVVGVTLIVAVIGYFINKLNQP